MKKLLFTLSLLFVISNSNAQSLDYGNDSDTFRICNALSGSNFLSDSAADTALDKILNVIGASKRFVLQSCSNINNAVALSYKGVRYIMYDPNFMQRISSSNDWVNMFILAHEVGHHINGHSVDVLLSDQDIAQVSLSQKRTQELEADEFAGFVLGRLGANLNDALSSVASMNDGDDSYSTHPSRSKRQAAIKKGFSDSGGKVDSRRSVSKGEIVDSKYSNSKYSGVKYTILNNYYNDAVYEGYVGISTNVPFGFGSFLKNDGTTYNGEFSDGKANGYGTMTYSDGTKYQGRWVNWNLTQGEVSYPDGGKEIGTFNENGLNGLGEVIEEDGGVIEGYFNSGNIIKATYVKDGKSEDFGFLDDSNGDGFGTYTFIFDGKLKSVFKNGVIKGTRGLFLFNNGNDKYSKGSLNREAKKNNLSNGLLSYIPESLRLNLDIKFNPEPGWSSYKAAVAKDDKWERLGYGTKSETTGTYNGYYLSGTKSEAGYGEFIYNSNDERKTYIGIWWNGKMNGYGQLTYKDGRVEKGLFMNNEYFKKVDFDLELMQKFLKDF